MVAVAAARMPRIYAMGGVLLRVAVVLMPRTLLGVVLVVLFGVVTVVHPKNRKAMGRQQFAVLEDPVALAWLAWFVTTSRLEGTARWRWWPGRWLILQRKLEDD